VVIVATAAGVTAKDTIDVARIGATATILGPGLLILKYSY
jgi:hypothetical protein